ncbi:MAG: MarR family winged helix-turn-helix transcriptional regulator [Pelagimonas sp.]|jgi:DNA-binding MarR family transcriptional regulator|nr:MarR family winged helix-turn-helix transcriptional regulator [Pelagimonas sp.]
MTTPPDTVPDFDLARFTPYRLARAAEQTSQALARQYRDRFGISIPEWRVLVHLSQASDVSVRDIEARVAMEKSKVSRAASRLEAAGYVTKRVHESDRRLVQLGLTDRGRDLMTRLLPLAAAYQQQIETQMGALFDQLDAGLDRLLQELDSNG